MQHDCIINVQHYCICEIQGIEKSMRISLKVDGFSRGYEGIICAVSVYFEIP